MTHTPAIDGQGSCAIQVASLPDPIRAERPHGEDRPQSSGFRADGLPTPARTPRTYSDEFGYRMGANRLGMDINEYANLRRAGFRWCFACKRWQLKEEFGPHKRMRDGIDTQCIEASRAYAREYQRRKRAAAKGAA